MSWGIAIGFVLETGFRSFPGKFPSCPAGWNRGVRRRGARWPERSLRAALSTVRGWTEWSNTSVPARPGKQGVAQDTRPWALRD